MATNDYPSIEFSHNPKNPSGGSQNVLVIVTGSGPLVSASLFSKRTWPCEITQGNGYHFVSFSAKSEEVMEETLLDINDAIVDFIDNPKNINTKIKSNKFTVAPPQETPPTT